MMPSSKSNGSSGGQVSHRLRNFFRINSAAHSSSSHSNSSSGGGGHGGGSGSEKDKILPAGSPSANQTTTSSDAPGTPKPSRHAKFFSNTVGRLRAHTVASEGNQLEEAISPTAHANPYFAHQGQPGLRHHNEGSVPPSPPDTPELKIAAGSNGVAVDQATSETKEELARRLRRVASAPNAQGLFVSTDAKTVPHLPEADRPATAELGKGPLLLEKAAASGAAYLTEGGAAGPVKVTGHASASDDVLAALPAPSTALAFRRTYSSNSIKVRNVEVNPSSFDKIKLIGKGDVGKVYLVREKKSSRLYAMKGS